MTDYSNKIKVEKKREIDDVIQIELDQSQCPPIIREFVTTDNCTFEAEFSGKLVVYSRNILPSIAK